MYRTWISNCIPQYTVAFNYLSMPKITGPLFSIQWGVLLQDLKKSQATRFVFRIIWSLCTSAALVLMCLSNFKGMQWFKLSSSRLHDFTISYDKMFYRILKWGPASKVLTWNHTMNGCLELILIVVFHQLTRATALQFVTALSRKWQAYLFSQQTKPASLVLKNVTFFHFNSSPLEQNGSQFHRQHFQMYFFIENVRVSIQISLKFVFRSSITVQ